MRMSQIKLKPYKQVFNTINRYTKWLASGKINYSKNFEKLASQLQQFMTQKGELSKTKTRSRKARQQFNSLIEQFRSEGLTTRAGIEAERKRAIVAKQIETFKKKKQAFSSEDYAQTIKNLEMQTKLAKGLNASIENYDDVLKIKFYEMLQITVDYGDVYNKENMQKIIDMTLQAQRENYPSIILDMLNEDDAHVLIEQTLDILQNEELSSEQLKQTFDIAQALNDSGEDADKLDIARIVTAGADFVPQNAIEQKIFDIIRML